MCKPNETRSMIRKLLISCVFTLVAPMASAADDAELEAVRAKITGMFESVEAENISPGPVPGWYVIAQAPIVAYVSADGRYLMQGDIIDLDTQTNVTEENRNDMRRGVLAELSDDDVIAFSPDDVRYSVAIFTDIDCTYCRKLHAEIDAYLDNGIEVRYLLYPRNGPASRSWSTAEQVWCSKDRNHSLTMAKLDKSFDTQQCDSPMVSDHYRLGRDIGLAGTPAIVLEDGSLIGGYLPAAQLKVRLDANAAQQKRSVAGR